MKQQFVTLLLLLMSLVVESQQWMINYPSDKDVVISLVAGDMSGEYNYSIGYKYDKITEVTCPLAICIDKNGNYTDRVFDDIVNKGFFCFALGLGDGNVFVMARCGDDNTDDLYEKMWVAILDNRLDILKENYIELDIPYVSYGSAAQALISDNDEIVVVSQVTDCVLSDDLTHYDYAFFKISKECDLLKSSYIENKSYYNEITDFTLVPYVGKYAVFGRGFRANGVETIFYVDNDLNYVSSDYIDSPYNYPNNFFPKFMCAAHWFDESHFIMTVQSSVTSGANEWRPIVLKMDAEMNILDMLNLERVDTTDYVSQFQNMVYIDAGTIYISTFWCRSSVQGLLPNTATVYLINEELELLGRKEVDVEESLNMLHIQPTFDKGCIIQGYIDYESYRVPIILKLGKSDFDKKSNLKNDEVSSIMNVFPNPVSSILYIDAKELYANVNVVIFDIIGRRYLDEEIDVNKEMIRMDVSSLKKGLYFYCLRDAKNNVVVQKFIKK